jgi:hypothetical protein
MPSTGAVAGDDPAGVAQFEDVSGGGVEQGLGGDAGVGAGDEQDLGFLRGGELRVALRVGADGLGEATGGGHQVVHGNSSGRVTFRRLVVFSVGSESLSVDSSVTCCDES